MMPMKTKFLEIGGTEETWGKDFWGMMAASMLVNGTFDEFARNQLKSEGIQEDKIEDELKEIKKNIKTEWRQQ